ncbi:MAG: hypothetical protein AAB783_00715 [Patescibacteria group bacterium]
MTHECEENMGGYIITLPNDAYDSTPPQLCPSLERWIKTGEKQKPILGCPLCDTSLIKPDESIELKASAA